MRIDLKHSFNEGITNLTNWRNRYSKEEYPFKIVQNIFYRQYTMDAIWDNQLQNSFKELSRTETDIIFAYQKIEVEYATASKAFASAEILMNLMNQQNDIGGINYKNSIELINKSIKGDNTSTEELEFRYLYRLLSNKSVLMWAAFGRSGFTENEAISQVLGHSIYPNQTFKYASILDLFGQVGIAPYLNNVYIPLTNLY